MEEAPLKCGLSTRVVEQHDFMPCKPHVAPIHDIIHYCDTVGILGLSYLECSELCCNGSYVRYVRPDSLQRWGWQIGVTGRR